MERLWKRISSEPPVRNAPRRNSPGCKPILLAGAGGTLGGVGAALGGIPVEGGIFVGTIVTLFVFNGSATIRGIQADIYFMRRFSHEVWKSVKK